MDLYREKRVPKNEEYEDDGTWIWISMASECRMVLSHVVGERNQMIAREIVAKTAESLASIPLFVTDGLILCRGSVRTIRSMDAYPPTGKRVRPRKDRLVPNDKLKYAQVIKKTRQDGRLKKVIKKTVLGKYIETLLISTRLIEQLRGLPHGNGGVIQQLGVILVEERVVLD
jgi:hypothetical protein